MEEDKHCHHELPKLYLQGFARKIDKKTKIWKFKGDQPYSTDVGNPPTNPLPLSLRKAAVIFDRYSFVDEEGNINPNDYEDRLMEMEHDNDVILKKIRTKDSISQAEKKIFAGYIQLMMKRVTRRDRREGKVLDIVGNVFAEQLHQRGFQAASSGDFKHARQNFTAEKKMPDLKKTALRETMVTQYNEINEKLGALKWAFYVAPPNTFFVTSDDPSVRLGALDKGPVIFPVSRSVAILMNNSHKHDLEYIPATPDQVAALNFLIIRNAELIYSPEPEKWIYDTLTGGIELNKDQVDFLHEIGS
jgi:hypothetical protein